ncbi:unnamed protein product [Cyprideis torosa]|uniref:Methionine synthase reductase n=1 Tax=Cyprideis torosa TaxID=163714 RepID=A0A7R8W5M3_9CRUS|nr:unnamed protein product [Cyprideis torosa]CAG0885457.1 unnamed protein product [Cyprideis torosa]
MSEDGSPVVVSDPSLAEFRIFYASQTGQAQAIAEDLLATAAAFGFRADIAPLNDIAAKMVRRDEKFGLPREEEEEEPVRAGGVALRCTVTDLFHRNRSPLVHVAKNGCVRQRPFVTCPQNHFAKPSLTPEEAELFRQSPSMLCVPGDQWKYRGEGKANIVVSFDPKSVFDDDDRDIRWLLRLRKTSSKKPDPVLQVQRAMLLQYRFLFNLMARILGPEIVPGMRLVLLCPNALDSIVRGVERFRKKSRQHRVILAGNSIAELIRDCAFLSSVEQEGVSYCVEIKPKQGFLFNEPDGLEICRFCLRQYSKVMRGIVPAISPYCPLDLFSGCPQRMELALLALMEQPQNNFRIFRNGETVFSEDTVSADHCLSEILSEWFPNVGAPRRTLISVLIASLSSSIPCGSERQKLKVPGNAPCDCSFSPCHQLKKTHVKQKVEGHCLPRPHTSILKEDSVLERILRIQKLSGNSLTEASDVLNRGASKTVDGLLEEVESLTSKMTTSDLWRRVDEADPLTKFQLSATANDCSILMTFARRKVLSDDCVPGQIRVSVETMDEQKLDFDCQVSVVDLDRKGVERVTKYMKDREECLRFYHLMIESILSSAPAVFVASTTGDGEPPENALKFWRKLRRTIKPGQLKTLEYSVLGLGDTNYTNFCNFGKNLDKQLEIAGGHRFYPSDWADDGTGLEIVVEPWKEGLWDALRVLLKKEELLAMKTGEKWTLPPLAARFLEVALVPNENEVKELSEDSHLRNLPAAAASVPLKAKVKSVRRLNDPSMPKKRMELCCTIQQDIPWLPGDSFGIFPVNNKEEVDFIFHRLQPPQGTNERHWFDRVFRIALMDGSKKKIPPFLPEQGTPRYILSRCLDIRAVPKKAHLRCLAEFAEDKGDKEYLLELCSREGGSKYTEMVQSGVTVLDLFTRCPSLRPTLSCLLEMLPRLTPRSYSVTCSPLVDSQRLTFAFTVVTDLPFGRKGLCTSWLEEMESGDDVLEALASLKLAETKIDLFLRSSVSPFHMPALEERIEDPEAASIPLILVGPGTGIAPFLGFLAHRSRQRIRNPEVTFGSIWLFHGCRSRKGDFIYENELNGFLDDGTLEKLFIAVSREQESKARYVQDLIRQNAAEVSTMILGLKARIFVCALRRRFIRSVNLVGVNLLGVNLLGI